MTRLAIALLAAATIVPLASCANQQAGGELAALEAKIAALELATADLANLREAHEALRREFNALRTQSGLAKGATTDLSTKLECDELRVGGNVVLTREGLFIGDANSGPSCSIYSHKAIWKHEDGGNLSLEPHRVLINDRHEDPRIVLEHNSQDDDAALFLKKQDAPMVALSATRGAATAGVFNAAETEPALIAVAEEATAGKVTALRMVRDGRLLWDATLGAAGPAVVSKP